MSNILREEDILTAWNFVNGSALVDYETIDLHTQMISAEKMLIRIQEYQQLSNEAKEVIGLILFGSTEVLNAIATPIKKTITIKLVRKFLFRHFSSEFIADHTIKELRNWANQL